MSATDLIKTDNSSDGTLGRDLHPVSPAVDECNGKGRETHMATSLESKDPTEGRLVDPVVNQTDAILQVGIVTGEKALSSVLVAQNALRHVSTDMCVIRMKNGG